MCEWFAKALERKAELLRALPQFKDQQMAQPVGDYNAELQVKEDKLQVMHRELGATKQVGAVTMTMQPASCRWL